MSSLTLVDKRFILHRAGGRQAWTIVSHAGVKLDAAVSGLLPAAIAGNDMQTVATT